MDLKTKLAQIEDDLSNLRAERAAKVRVRDDAKAAFAKIDGYDKDSPEYQAAAAAIKDVSAVDDLIASAQEAQVGILQMLGQEDPVAAAEGTGRAGGSADDLKKVLGWDSAKLFAADELRQRLEHAAGSTGRFGRMDLGQVADRDTLAAELGSTNVGGLIVPDQRGLLPTLFRPLRLLDLIPSGTTNSNLVEYVQVTTLPSSAAETAEGSAKPEETFGFTDAESPIRTIAGWVKVRKQTLADARVLQAFIDNALRYDVRRRFEAQIANGNGSGQNIRGILQTTGISAATVVTADSPADRIHHGIVDVQLANQEPTFVGIHPRDYETVRLSRDASGAAAGTGGYLFGPPSQGGNPTIWGLPPVVSTAFPQGTALVGDAGAALALIREGVNVLISDSDQDDFIKNRVTLLGEMRGGLVVWRPDGFSKVNLGVVS